MTPAIGPGLVIERPPKHVQGIGSDLDGITLRGGGKLMAHIGPAVVTKPVLKRGMGNSSIEIMIYDPKRRWLKKSLASEKWDVEVDGLRFRYIGTSKQGKTLTLKFEDWRVARMREFFGPIRQLAHRGKPNEVTRAEFIVSLVLQVFPTITIVCPELHKRQPIESAQAGRQAQDDADADRDKGIGDVRGLEVKGVAATADQKKIGDRAIRAAESFDAPAAVILAMMAALIVESGLGAFSRNYMEMTPEAQGDSKYDAYVIEEAVTGFLKGYVPGKKGALEVARENPEMKPYEIAQEVQASGAGASSNGAANYGPWVDEAREWLDAYGGAGGSGETTITKAREWKVGEKETFWKAIDRYADEVNWRAFFLGDRFFYISEPDLIASKVRLDINCNLDGEFEPEWIEDVDFDFNENKPISSATITAFVRDWGVPPGAVATLAGLGPASLGFGQGPIKPDKKGRLMAVSGGMKVGSREGRGRYLVSTIEVNLAKTGDSRLATIAVRRPTPPRPEPANETETVGGESSSSAEGAWPPKVQAIVDYIDACSEGNADYLWGGGHASFAGPDEDKDCSGFTSGAVHEAGYLSAPLTSDSFASVFPQGEGEWVTIWGNARHVFLTVKYPDGHLRYAGTGGDTGGGGWVDENNPTSGAAARGDKVASHPPGL
ncbi:MAG TPA: hypothetical protein VFX35_01590 [Solirubrobacterales bacterium]|nr:hypothetical protein [Solirubrobacterales bacterium]